MLLLIYPITHFTPTPPPFRRRVKSHGIKKLTQAPANYKSIIIDLVRQPCLFAFLYSTLTIDAFAEASIPWPVPTLATIVWQGIFNGGLGNVLPNPDALDFRPRIWIQPFHPPGTMYVMLLFEYVGSIQVAADWLVINSPPMRPLYDSPTFQEPVAYRQPLGGGRTYVFLVLRQLAEGPLVLAELPTGTGADAGRVVDVDSLIEMNSLELYQGSFFSTV